MSRLPKLPRIAVATICSSVVVVLAGGVVVAAHLTAGMTRSVIPVTHPPPSGVPDVQPAPSVLSSGSPIAPAPGTTSPASTSAQGNAVAETPSPSSQSGIPTPPNTYYPDNGGNHFDITMLVQSIDTIVGQQLCFNHTVAVLHATVDGQIYNGYLALETESGGTWARLPLQFTLTSPRTYDITPQGCFTFTGPGVSGVPLTIWTDPTQLIPLDHSITFRIHAAPRQSPAFVAVVPTSLDATHGLPRWFYPYPTASFHDPDIVNGYGDAYSGVIDWGDGTTPSLGQVALQGGGTDLLSISITTLHTWAAPGTFTITFRLTDSDGDTASGTVPVTVA